MSDRTLVASATNLLARGFLVVPTDRRSREGEPVNALFAVARAIHRVLAWKLPARAVAVIEAAPDLARWPPLLVPQLAPLRALLEALGVHVVEAPGEVHVVASYARAALDRGDDVVVVGVDKRFAQLVGDRLWWYDANKDARYTPEIVVKRFTVPPAKVAGWLALVGDDDALPGVKGIGAKGATTLIEQHGSIEGALAAIEEIPGRLGNVLRAARDDVPRELVRARLDTGRPLPVALEALAFTPAPAPPRNELYERMGFAELLSHDGASTSVELCETPEALHAQLGQLAQLGAGPIAIHALLEDPDPVRAAVTGIALSVGGDKACYVARDAAAWPALVAWLEDKRAPKLGHELIGTIVALHHAGIRLAGIAGDSAFASHLTQPSNWAPHDLALVAKHVLGRALLDPDAVRGVGRARKRWAQLPVDRAAELAGQAADASNAVWAQLAPHVPAALLDEYRALQDTLVRMELTGLIVDRDELAGAEAAFATIEAELAAEIEALAGHPFNINSSKQLGSVLFEELKLPIVSHTKTGWSTSIEALERIEHAHPIVARVLRWRLLRRLRDSWLLALRRCIDADGRVHSRFHPARSFSGHLVNTGPDLGRVPGRTPEMQRIRRAFVAPPSCVLMSVDYHQLGLYVLAHLTRDPALVEPLRRRDDMHVLTAAAVLDRPTSAITADERQLGKVVNFATFAGQGASALALQLGVSAQEARQLIARFDQRYAQVRAFQDEQLRLAHERGYVVTLAGRRWPIGGLASLDPHDRSYAERLARRATHEGSVADVSRRGLLEADRALRREGLAATPLVQVVDEVLFEVPEAELATAARVAAHAMRHAFELAVPLVVGVEAGKTWADLAPVVSVGVDEPP
ncbi:MAG TPA: DNA polymerase [Kofleriaceae bacterium]|nr:DNA polymerase [Kofleriaceae bacterium]